MLSTIADHIKRHRHELGHHALWVGSRVVIPPRERRMDEILAEMAVEWAGHRLDALPPEQRAKEAQELLAREVPDHAVRCQMLREKLKDARPAEGHIRLARLIKDGYFPTIFLAEPDRLLEQALAVHHMDPEQDYHHFVAGPDDPETIAVGLRDSTRVVVVKCCGDVESKFLPLSLQEISDVYEQLSDTINETFRVFSIFVAYADRDAPFLQHVSRDGGKVFWVNRMIPMRDERLFDELRIENPASVEYHQYQPEVMALLESRHSSRHLLCREPGTFNEFFGKLHSRLTRRSHRSHERRRKELTVLRGGPYRFLDYFDVRDEEFFFGREDDTEALLELIRAHPVTVLCGKSGIGKTSLLRAGVVADLQRASEQAEEASEGWLAVAAVCGDDPAANIRASILTAVEEMGFDPYGLPDGGSLADFLQATSQLVKRRIMVGLDQFEEYFVHLGPMVQEAFLEQLTECLERLPEVRWLICIREDYVGNLLDLQPRLPTIMHHMYRLRRLTREQAEDAIVRPAQNFDISVERALVERVLNDLYRDGVEPAQLQIVCDRLYEGKPRGMHTITGSVYDRLGGAQKILAGFLDQILGQLNAADRRLARTILKTLVASSEVPVTRPLERIAADANEDREEVERVLARLVDLRLVRAVGKERHRQYELIHEYLADKITGWLSEKEVQVQDVQDLLTRHLNNYSKFGILMHADELRIINEARETLSISEDELELILRSAATEQMDVEYWFGRLGELGERQVPLMRSLLQHDLAHVRRAAARAAASHPHRRYIPQLVKLLDDADDGVQEEARTALLAMERELISELSRGPDSARAAAARALGRLRLKRGLRPLLDVIEDGDDDLRREVTEALIALAEPRTHEILLRRLTGADGLPWAGAYALGHLGLSDDVLRALRTAAESYPELAKLHYAIGIAHAQRREFREAAEYLQRAQSLTRTEQGLALVQASLQEIEQGRQRSAMAVGSWPMFHRSPDHCGAMDTELKPPLRILWSFKTRGPIMASPVVADGIAMVGSRDSHLYAIDAKRGTELWRLRTGDRIESTPAVGEGRVYVGSYDGRVYAAATDSGRRLWQRDLGAPIRSSATLVGTRLYVGNRSGQVFCLDAGGGEILWSTATRAEVSSSPAVSNGVVIAASWDGSIYALNAETGEVVWKHATEGPVASSPAVATDVVYCGSDDGHLYALACADGRLYWRVPVGSQVRSSPAVSNDRVIVGLVDGRIVALAAADGDPVWTVRTAEEVLASPAIAGHVVYVGSKDGALYGLSLDSGDQLWRHQTSYGVYSSPAIADDTLFVGLDYYDLAALVSQD
ncbi:MAG: PQQ-binding-like beta-propeller repeat protein [Armatimonadetes bacterium]|nr:PQQ-binding-like beta-propeller repeat protein [Armatimonadota bacterium]